MENAIKIGIALVGLAAAVVFVYLAGPTIAADLQQGGSASTSGATQAAEPITPASTSPTYVIPAPTINYPANQDPTTAASTSTAPAATLPAALAPATASTATAFPTPIPVGGSGGYAPASIVGTYNSGQPGASTVPVVQETSGGGFTGSAAAAIANIQSATGNPIAITSSGGVIAENPVIPPAKQAPTASSSPGNGGMLVAAINQVNANVATHTASTATTSTTKASKAAVAPMTIVL